MKPLNVSQLAARRFLLESQQLLLNHSESVESAGFNTALQMVRKLECVQLDPVSVVERNQHLVLAARIPGYKPEHLDELLSEGKVFEYMANAACVIPVKDYPIFEPVRERLYAHVKDSLNNSSQAVQSVLDRLKAEGPLPSRAFKSENRVHGYWDNKVAKTKETSHVLNLLLDAGSIRVVHREGTERFFGLTESTIPMELLKKAEKIELPEARKALIDKYIRAYRLFDLRDSRFGWQKMPAVERRAEVERRVREGAVIPVGIENVKRSYFIMVEDLERLQAISQNAQKEKTPLEGAIRFLPPLDNLLWRRDRLVDLFDFHYRWEIYTPRSKRRYGAYAMPILYGDQLIGRMDPRLDRKNGCLIVQLLQLEPGVDLTSKLRRQLREALESFANFHGVQNITVEKTEPSGLKVL
ncbi:MAG TPA: crosslink repair DNA glycosylase YcaQ family protein [Bacillales bacterium]